MKSPVRFGILGAFIALAAALGVVSTARNASLVDAQIPAGVSVARTCVATNIAVGATTTCTTTITNPGAAVVGVPLPVTLTTASTLLGGTPPAGTSAAYGQVLLLGGAENISGFDITNVTVNNTVAVADAQVMSVNACANPGGVGNPPAGQCRIVPLAGGTAATTGIQFTEVYRGRVGGAVATTINFGAAGLPVSLGPSINIGAVPVVASIVCANLVTGTNNNACTLTFSDTDGFANWVSSANLTLKISSGNAVFTANGTALLTLNCAATGTQTPQGCQSVNFSVNATAVGNLTIDVVYQPDIPAVNSPVVLNGLGVIPINFGAPPVVVPPVAPILPFVQPIGIRMTCGTTGAVGQPTPAQIGGINIFAIGTLPAAINCTAEPLIAAGTVGIVAPGTFEISSLSSGLQSAIGSLTTNLRIGCDRDAILVIGVVQQNPNTCNGVAFRVYGTQVGASEIRARYEPSAAAAAAGIRDVEFNFWVAFVAPTVTVSMILSPNAATVGQTVTATARFNRTNDCAAVTLNPAVPACIDPTTGVPITFNIGSALNGNTTFTIDNSLIASWTDAGGFSPASGPQSTGFVSSANQTIRRCGLFPTVAFPTGGATPGLGAPFIFGGSQVPSTIGPLAAYFGGCESVSANLRTLNAGVATVTATFLPDLPGAFGSNVNNVAPQIAALIGYFGGVQPTSVRLLEVANAAASGAVSLVKGCNNISPTVSEAASSYAARITPQGALIAIWEHQPANNSFKGFSPQAGAPNDLTGTTRLRPVFVCVSGPATLDQPAA